MTDTEKVTKALVRQNAEIALECFVVEPGKTLFTEQVRS